MNCICTYFNLKRECVVWHQRIRFHRSLALRLSIGFCVSWDKTPVIMNELLSGWPRNRTSFPGTSFCRIQIVNFNIFILPSFPTGLCVSIFVSAFDNLIY